MARPPKPWPWKQRKVWCVVIDGTRHELAPLSDKKEAMARFHELMANPKKRIVRFDSVEAILSKFLDHYEKHKAPDTYEWYRYRLERFVKRHPDLLVQELKVNHVQVWIDEMVGLEDGSLRNHCRAIKRAMRWALQQGLIEVNPIAAMEMPKAGKRETVISQQEFDYILSQVPSPEFRELLQVTWETGCRPQESLAVEARHVDLKNNRWVFVESEAKGDVGRAVYLTEEAAFITRRLMARYPSGRLLRNSKGKPWTTEAVNCSFIRLQQKLGLARAKQEGLEPSEKEIAKFAKTLAPTRTVKGEEARKTRHDLMLEARRKLRLRQAEALAPKYSLYTLRHSWATHALEKGVDSLTVAVLMGHRDPSTLAKVYQHLSHNPDFLLEQAKKAAG